MLSGLSNELLGERLRMARVGARLTQQAAATALGMARTTIVAIEQGLRRVTPEEAAAFANLYSISTGKLLSPDAVHIDLAAKFRKLEKVDERATVRQAVDLLNRLTTGAVELERALGISFPIDYPPPLHILPRQVVQQAEDAAISLRHRLGLGLGRLPDPFEFLELDLGIRVFVRPIEDGSISGLYAFEQEVGACILINANHSEMRRRQSLVHEVGHFISDRSYADVLDEHPTPTSIDERFARRFGPAFLMPAPTVRARFEQIAKAVGEPSVRELILLSRQFDVATEAMCRRLEDLDLLASGTWEYLKSGGFTSAIEDEVAGTRINSTPQPAIPARLIYLASKALEAEILSEGQLAEMLVIDRLQLRRSISSFMGADSRANEISRE